MNLLSPAAPAVQVLLVAAGAYLLSTVLTPLVRKMAVAAGCVSRPADDRWGRRVVPRLGGLPIGLGFLLCTAWAALSDSRMAGLLAGGILILIIGLIDDFKPLHPNTKLIAQILAGCAVSLGGIQVDLPGASWLAVPLTIGWLVLVMNAFNLMDNMDGLSAGIGAIAASFCVWQALQTGQVLVAVVAAALAGATLGFLQFNLPPARIFMGDTGSQVLGLGLGALALLQTWHHSARLLGLLALPTLLLAVPIFDTLFVTVQRMTHGRHPFQGGTDHLSHRLGVLGLNPMQVVLTFYALAAVFGLLSIFLAGQNPVAITGILLFALGGLLLLGAYLSKVRVYAAPASAELPAARFTMIDTMLMHKRRILEVAVDFAFVCGCYVAAHALRFEAYLTPDTEKLLYQSLPWVIAVKMSCLFACGLYRGVWRYMGVPDLVTILRSVALSSVLSALVVLYLWRFEGFSRAVFIIDGTLLFLAISGARLAEPMFNEWISSSVARSTQVLVIGAGDTGEMLSKQLKIDRQGNRRVAAFLDDDPLKKGSRIHGIPIVGSRRELGRVVKEMGIQEVFVAIRRPPEELLRQVQGYCEENGLRWTVVTSLTPSEPAPRPQG